MSVPLVLQFFIGLSMQGIFTALSTLLVDIHPSCPSTAQAASNFVRCEMAAGGLALLDIILRSMEAGWCFVLFGGVGLVMVSSLFALELKGLQWRQKRVLRKNHASTNEGTA